MKELKVFQKQGSKGELVQRELEGWKERRNVHLKPQRGAAPVVQQNLQPRA